MKISHFNSQNLNLNKLENPATTTKNTKTMSNTIKQGKKGEIEIQITMDIVALVIILPLFIFYLIRIFIKKQYRNRNLRMLAISMFYNLCAIFACLYELLYRFSYEPDQCWISDLIQEIFICFTRSVLLIWYVALVDDVFNNEKTPYNIRIPRYCINGYYLFIIIVHMIILPSIYIPLAEANPYLVGEYGVFCFTNLIKNNTAYIAIILYQLTDALITCFLTGIFIQRLCNMQDKSDVNIGWLKRMILCSFILTLVSIISSWFIIGAGRLDGDNPSSYWRWMYPLDYIPNCLCVFCWIWLMYKDTSPQPSTIMDIENGQLQNEVSMETPRPDEHTLITMTPMLQTGSIKYYRF